MNQAGKFPSGNFSVITGTILITAEEIINPAAGLIFLSQTSISLCSTAASTAQVQGTEIPLCLDPYRKNGFLKSSEPLPPPSKCSPPRYHGHSAPNPEASTHGKGTKKNGRRFSHISKKTGLTGSFSYRPTVTAPISGRLTVQMDMTCMNLKARN